MKNIIAVDIGNTETTVGIGSKDNWDSYRFTTRDTNTPDELLALFNSTFQIKSEVKILKALSFALLFRRLPIVLVKLFASI